MPPPITSAPRWTCATPSHRHDGCWKSSPTRTSLGADFGDAYLEPGESLSALLEQRLPGVPRVAYTAAGDAAPHRAQGVLE